MMQKELSLIVSMYNIEHELGACLRSIEKQLRGNPSVEVLLVDDGSTDGTSRIAKEYAERNRQMHYFHQKNGGVSSARNYGLAKASGRFVWFVDGDDEIADGALDVLVERLEGCVSELLTFDYVIWDGNVRKVVGKQAVFADGQSFSGIEYLKSFYLGCVWQHVYNRLFLLKGGLLFMEGLPHEDNEFDMRVFANAKVLEYAHAPLYIYHKYAVRMTLSKVKSLRDTCSVFPLMESSCLMERKTRQGIIAYHGAFIMNVILACDYALLSKEDKKVFEREFVRSGKRIFYCYWHSVRLMNKLQAALMVAHPLLMLRVWMFLLKLRKWYEDSFHH